MANPRAPLIVSGATGFVGRTLCSVSGVETVALKMRNPDWLRAAQAMPMAGATIFHLAARVHRTTDSEQDFLRDNAEKTRQLAEMAAREGARRLVFLSTVKVNGEETRDRPFAADDPPAPQGAYARSKLAAEQALREIASRGSLEVTIVRAPLVYGSGAAGNARSLARLAAMPWPLPFAALDNRRSFIHVHDLARLLLACGSSPVAAGRTYMAAHREAASTRALITELRASLGRPSRLFAVPPRVLEACASLLGEGPRIRKLTRSLEVDAAPAERELGWRADKALRDAASDLATGLR